ncbi:MAG: hypothetical protein J3Q66DRAFT_425247 [Benniella sp.]|nr:MAG: hypothetical protein J3Q66DRAFT_425247 [Benniella sp.]
MEAAQRQQPLENLTNSSIRQELLGTVSGPCHGRTWVPVLVHEPSGTKYIPLCSIRAVYSTMTRLETEDGVLIQPQMGFDNLGNETIPRKQEIEPTASTTSADMTEPMLEEPITTSKSSRDADNNGHGTVMVKDKPAKSYSKDPTESDSEIEVNYENTSDEEEKDPKEDPVRPRKTSSIQSVQALVPVDTDQTTGGESHPPHPLETEKDGLVTTKESVQETVDPFEWIEYFPGRVIHVVHDRTSLDEGPVPAPQPDRPQDQDPNQNQIQIQNETQSQSQHQPPLDPSQFLQADIGTLNSTLAATALLSFQDAYWQRFRQETQKMLAEQVQSLRQSLGVITAAPYPNPVSSSSLDPTPSLIKTEVLSLASRLEEGNASASSSRSVVAQQSRVSSPKRARESSVEPTDRRSQEKQPRLDSQSIVRKEERYESYRSDTRSSLRRRSQSPDTRTSPRRRSRSPKPCTSPKRRSRSPSPRSSPKRRHLSPDTDSRKRRSPRREREDSRERRRDRERVLSPQRPMHASESSNRRRDPLPPPQPPQPQSRRSSGIAESSQSVARSWTGATTITVRDAEETRNFVSFLQKGYRDTRLDLTMDWAWERQDMEKLYHAIMNSQIKTLFLNCKIPQIPQTRSGSSSGLKTSRTPFDPLVKLLGARKLQEIHLLEVPDVLLASNTAVPFDLSHLDKVRIRLDMDKIKTAPRVTQFLERATHLRDLIVDCGPHHYRESFEAIIRPIAKIWSTKYDGPSALSLARAGGAMFDFPMPIQPDTTPKPPPFVNIQYHHQHAFPFLSIKVERDKGFIREFTLDMAASPPSTVIHKHSWITAFDSRSDMASPLTALRLKNMREESWIPDLLQWIQAVHRKGGHQVALEELYIHCKTLTQFRTFCEFIENARSTLLSIELVDIWPKPTGPPPPPVTAEQKEQPKPGRKKEEEKEEGAWSSGEEGEAKDIIPQGPHHRSSSSGGGGPSEWTVFFKSLNFMTLTNLHLEKNNLTDMDITAFVDCLQHATEQGKYPLALKTLRLVKTEVTAKGLKELILACTKNRWAFKLDHRD